MERKMKIQKSFIVIVAAMISFLLISVFIGKSSPNSFEEMIEKELKRNVTIEHMNTNTKNKRIVISTASEEKVVDKMYIVEIYKEDIVKIQEISLEEGFSFIQK